MKKRARLIGRAAVKRRTDLHDGEDAVGRDQELHFPTLRAFGDDVGLIAQFGVR